MLANHPGFPRPTYLLRDPGVGRAAMPGTDFGSPRVWSWQAPDTCRGPHPTPEGYQPPSHAGQSGARPSLAIAKDLLAPVASPCMDLINTLPGAEAGAGGGGGGGGGEAVGRAAAWLCWCVTAVVPSDCSTRSAVHIRHSPVREAKWSHLMCQAHRGY